MILSTTGKPIRTNQCPSPGNFDDYLAMHCGNDKLCQSYQKCYAVKLRQHAKKVQNATSQQ